MGLSQILKTQHHWSSSYSSSVYHHFPPPSVAIKWRDKSPTFFPTNHPTTSHCHSPFWVPFSGAANVWQPDSPAVKKPELHRLKAATGDCVTASSLRIWNHLDVNETERSSKWPFFTKDNWWELDDDQPVDVRLPFFSDENHFKNAEPIILTHAQGSTTIQCHISQEKLRKCLSQMSPSRHYMRWPKGKKHLGCFFGRYNVCPMENRIPQKW